MAAKLLIFWFNCPPTNSHTVKHNEDAIMLSPPSNMTSSWKQIELASTLQQQQVVSKRQWPVKLGSTTSISSKTSLIATSFLSKPAVPATTSVITVSFIQVNPSCKDAHFASQNMTTLTSNKRFRSNVYKNNTQSIYG